MITQQLYSNFFVTDIYLMIHGGYYNVHEKVIFKQ